MNPLLKIKRKISVSFSGRGNAHTIHIAVFLQANIQPFAIGGDTARPWLQFLGVAPTA
jgi:hypothetical protein